MVQSLYPIMQVLKFKRENTGSVVKHDSLSLRPVTLKHLQPQRTFSLPYLLL